MKKLKEISYNLAAVIFALIAMIISIYNIFVGELPEIIVWFFIWGSLLMLYLGESKRSWQLRKKVNFMRGGAMQAIFRLEDIKDELQEENPDRETIQKCTDESITELRRCLDEACNDHRND